VWFRYERLYGRPQEVARIAVGRSRPSNPTDKPGDRPRPYSVMDQVPTPTSLWRTRAMTVMQRVMAAERRFSASISVNEITMLAAADELAAATRDAKVWLKANPCPDAKLGAHVAGMLDTCTEVARVAQRAVTGPVAGSQGVMARLRDLLAVIGFHSAILTAW
jgi:predicted secreted protein